MNYSRTNKIPIIIDQFHDEKLIHIIPSLGKAIQCFCCLWQINDYDQTSIFMILFFVLSTLTNSICNVIGCNIENMFICNVAGSNIVNTNVRCRVIEHICIKYTKHKQQKNGKNIYLKGHRLMKVSLNFCMYSVTVAIEVGPTPTNRIIAHCSFA